MSAAQLEPFERLVHSTARMFAAQVRREEEDLAQELRIVVWRAVSKFDPGRSSITLGRFVFGAVTNKIKDYKRDAAREYDRRQLYGVAFLHIETMRLINDNDDRQANFDGRYNFVDRDEIYGAIDEGKFVLPASVSEREARVLMMLMMDMTKAEVALALGMTRAQVDAIIASLRGKFADWEPSSQPDDSSRVVDFAVAA